jgi:SAM-dependent methyltransferase
VDAHLTSRDARYDGFADWYDEQLAAFSLEATDAIRRFVGPGPGRCLDIGCGTGLHLPTLLELGWSVVAVDISRDMLRRARGRAADVEFVEADVTSLPFADNTFDVALAAFTHTDVDDLAGLVSEAARVVREGGKLALIGLHPCFVGPHARAVDAREPPQLLPGYREHRRYEEAPGISPDGLRAKVGAVHVPLGELVQSVIDNGFTLDAFEELGSREYPQVVAIAAHTTAR